MAKSFRQIVSEMIGKITPQSDWLNKVSLTWDLYKKTPSVDYSKTDYALTRAIFYASVIEDGGKSKGKQFLMGAVFGKPIVNFSAALAFAQLPEISVDTENGKEADDSATKLADWFEENQGVIFKTARNSLRDGDQYIKVNDDLTPEIIDPAKVDIVDDPITGEIKGYNVTTVVDEPDENGNSTSIKYVEQYRKVTPFYQLLKFVPGDKTGSVQSEETSDDPEEERILPIVGFHNEKEPSWKYGNSEFQNIFYLMANYHAIAESGIKNVIYNSTALPVVSGVDDVNKWLQTNGTKQNDGTYKVKWDGDKLFIGGKDFKVEIVQAPDTATSVEKMMNLLFWCICQASETPEYAMGTAVSSSKASVSEQSPVAVRKAERKRAEYSPYYVQLCELVLAKAQLLEPAIRTDVTIKIQWPDLMDDDMTLNLETIKVLSEQGTITDHTKMLLMNMQKYVQDIDEEIKAARLEIGVKNEALTTQFSTSSTQADQEEEAEPEDTNAEDEE